MEIEDLVNKFDISSKCNFNSELIYINNSIYIA